MATTCLDKILCENAWDCSITITDINGNPIDPLKISDGETIIIVLGDKPGYTFQEFMTEDGRGVYAIPLGDNRYKLINASCRHRYLARYCPITYTVARRSDSICFQDEIVDTAHYGDVVRIEAPENYGCHFLNWTRDDVVVSESPSFDYVVTENVIFVAHYDSILYSIVAKPNYPERGVCTGTGVYELNETVELTSEANTGFVFTGWNDGYPGNNRTVSVNGNRTYVANFVKDENHVRVVANPGGTIVGAGIYETGKTATLQAMPYPGWKFVCWVIEGRRYTDQTYSFVVNSDKRVQAVFTAASYTVNIGVSPAGCGYFEPSLEPSYRYGQKVAVEAKEYYGYSFVSWSDGYSERSRTLTVESDIDLIAYFKENVPERTLSLVLPDDSYTCGVYYGYTNISTKIDSVVKASALEGTIVTLSPLIPEGKKLVSVTLDGTPIWTENDKLSNIKYTIGDSDAELVLNYSDLYYTLTLTVSPLNSETTNLITLGIYVGVQYQEFTPTLQNPYTTLSEVPYGTEIRVIAPSSEQNADFSYWVLPDGSFNENDVTFRVTKDFECCAIYSISENANEVLL